MMNQHKISFEVGDQVVHWIHGIGKIIQLENKRISGETTRYYVVQIRDLTLWVPISEEGQRCLRYPTPQEDFKSLFRILSGPGEELSVDRYSRKNELTVLMKDRTIASICRVIRDLTNFKQNHKVNESDNSILNQAKEALLNEWSLVLSVPVSQAEKELRKLLMDGVV
jgi:CarD family transcriptional regulator